ncbi:Mbov_0395 family pilin-like conjugal transfer protein [Mesomycoplasma ovipneumoniae]
MENLISLFQQQNQIQQNLDKVKDSVNGVSNAVMGYALIGVSAVTGIIVVASIIWFMARLLQAKFAGPEQKKIIYRNIKQSAWIFGAIILLLVVGVGVIGAITNLTGSFTEGIKDTLSSTPKQ